jgi:hypothetical protein
MAFLHTLNRSAADYLIKVYSTAEMLTCLDKLMELGNELFAYLVEDYFPL